MRKKEGLSMTRKPQLWTQSELESFASGIQTADQIIEELDPDLIIAPMMGAVPLVDALNAVNPYFDNSRVYYVPASSTLEGVRQIIPNVMLNVLLHVVDPDFPVPLKLLSLDEVVSGNSIKRVRKGLLRGIQRFAEIRELNEEEKKEIELFQIGFEQDSYLKSGKSWVPAYKELRGTKDVLPIRVEKIITMDTPQLCPAQYKRSPNNPARYLPLIEPDAKLTPEYLNLLEQIAIVAGHDPNMSGPRNLHRMQLHQIYAQRFYS